MKTLPWCTIHDRPFAYPARKAPHGRPAARCPACVAEARKKVRKLIAQNRRLNLRWNTVQRPVVMVEVFER